jgi:hypothetical protein
MRELLQQQQQQHISFDASNPPLSEYAFEFTSNIVGDFCIFN